MCILKKGNNIVLENDTCISANVLILLVGNKNNGLAAFLNDYNLIVYASEALGIATLIGIWAFITPSKLLR